MSFLSRLILYLVSVQLTQIFHCWSPKSFEVCSVRPLLPDLVVHRALCPICRLPDSFVHCLRLKCKHYSRLHTRCRLHSWWFQCSKALFYRRCHYGPACHRFRCPKNIRSPSWIRPYSGQNQKQSTWKIFCLSHCHWSCWLYPFHLCLIQKLRSKLEKLIYYPLQLFQEYRFGQSPRRINFQRMRERVYYLFHNWLI